MMRRLRRLFRHEPSPVLPGVTTLIAHMRSDIRDARARSLAQQRAANTVARALRDASVDYDALNRTAFGRPPYQERKGERS